MKLIEEQSEPDGINNRHKISHLKFPALVSAIEKLVREEAEGYADFRKQLIYKAGNEKWVSGNCNFYPDFWGTSEQLFDLYKSEQLKTLAILSPVCWYMSVSIAIISVSIPESNTLPLAASNPYSRTIARAALYSFSICLFIRGKKTFSILTSIVCCSTHTCNGILFYLVYV